MLEKVIDRLLKLFEIKSIITLTLTFVVSWGFVTKIVPVELMAAWYGSIITYFFMKDKKESL